MRFDDSLTLGYESEFPEVAFKFLSPFPFVVTARVDGLVSFEVPSPWSELAEVGFERDAFSFL